MFWFVLVLIATVVLVFVKYPFIVNKTSKAYLDKIAKEEKEKTYKVEYYPSGALKSEKFLKEGGLRMQPDGPFVIDYCPDGITKESQIEAFYISDNSLEKRTIGYKETKWGLYCDGSGFKDEIYSKTDKKIKHRNPLDGPAVISVGTKDGKTVKKSYWVDGVNIRYDGMNITFYPSGNDLKKNTVELKYDDGLYVEEKWCDAKCHLKVFSKDRVLLKEYFYEYGEVSRPFDEGPAKKYYGKKYDEECYILNGKDRQTSDGGPGWISCDKQGQVILESWSLEDKRFIYFKEDGKLHRPIEEGPARIVYKGLEKIEESYFEDGIFIPQDEIEIRIKKAKELAEFEKLPKPEQEYLMGKWNVRNV